MYVVRNLASCVVLTPEQLLKLSIPKYKIGKKKKAEAGKDTELVDPCSLELIPLPNNKQSLCHIFYETPQNPSLQLSKFP